MIAGCAACGRPTCDGCPLCCCEHPGHKVLWEPSGCSDCNARFFEQGRLLASERDDLIASGADPAELLIPLAPTTPLPPDTDCTSVGSTGEGRCIEPAVDDGLCATHAARRAAQ